MHGDESRPLRLADLLATLTPENEYYAITLEHATLEVGVYAPRASDPQTPHTRDEVYVVVRGRGLFFRSGRRTPFGPGDLIFVPAGEEHRFEQFSDDFAAWVIFYGPEGGERPAPPSGAESRD
jgi:mannose-6-phosphate isomerase-like protein (cupin superfamily)